MAPETILPAEVEAEVDHLLTHLRAGGSLTPAILEPVAEDMLLAWDLTCDGRITGISRERAERITREVLWCDAGLDRALCGDGLYWLAGPDPSRTAQAMFDLADRLHRGDIAPEEIAWSTIPRDLPTQTDTANTADEADPVRQHDVVCWDLIAGRRTRPFTRIIGMSLHDRALQMSGPVLWIDPQFTIAIALDGLWRLREAPVIRDSTIHHGTPVMAQGHLPLDHILHRLIEGAPLTQIADDHGIERDILTCVLTRAFRLAGDDAPRLKTQDEIAFEQLLPEEDPTR